MVTTREKYGYLGRIGFIAPGSTIETIPFEFYKVVPDGIIIVFTSIGIKRLTPDDIEKSLERIEDSASELARTKVDVIILGGSPPIIFGGFGFEKCRCSVYLYAFACQQEKGQAAGFILYKERR